MDLSLALEELSLKTTNQNTGKLLKNFRKSLYDRFQNQPDYYGLLLQL